MSMCVRQALGYLLLVPPLVACLVFVLDMNLTYVEAYAASMASAALIGFIHS